MILYSVLFLASLLATWQLCGLVRRHLLANDVLDRPNGRSMHQIAVPRGGGFGIWMGVIPLWVVALLFQKALGAQAGLIAGTMILISVSWLDDRKSLSPLIRLYAHIGAVIAGLAAFAPDALVFQGIFPFWLDRVLAAFCWVWFINLTNFMDGIDGISGAETAHVSLGFLFVAALTPLGAGPAVALAACLLGSSLGFLKWNWQPAKLFLGDVGSVPLGYLLGYLMLVLATNGFLGIALALPLYYIADASITLVRRMIEKKKFWQPHREHFYQKAALAIGSHAQTVLLVISANAALLLICLLSLKTGVWALILAPLPVAALLWYLNRLAQQTRK